MPPSFPLLLSSPLLLFDSDYESDSLHACSTPEKPTSIDLTVSPPSHLDDDLDSLLSLFPSPLVSLAPALPESCRAAFLSADDATIRPVRPTPISPKAQDYSYLSGPAYDEALHPALEFDFGAGVWRSPFVESVRPTTIGPLKAGPPKRSQRPGPGDCFSPRWTRIGVEKEEEALCEVCEPRTKELETSEWRSDAWFTTSGRYTRHMSTVHGISPAFMLPFTPPLCTRPSMFDGAVGYRMDGMCYCCGSWIDSAITWLTPSPLFWGPNVNFSTWFHHARACHPDAKSLLQPGLPILKPVQVVDPTAPIPQAPKPRFKFNFNPSAAPPPERKAARRRQQPEEPDSDDAHDDSGDGEYRPFVSEARPQPKRVRTAKPTKRIRKRW